MTRRISIPGPPLSTMLRAIAQGMPGPLVMKAEDLSILAALDRPACPACFFPLVGMPPPRYPALHTTPRFPPPPPPEDQVVARVFKMPPVIVVLDPSMPPDQMELRSGESRLRIVNIGPSSPGAGKEPTK